MGLFKWLQKQYEKTLPYKVIDVTPDELLDYVGKGTYVVSCRQNEKAEIIDWLLASSDADDDTSSVLRKDRSIVIWRDTITDWNTDLLKRDKDFSTWLRVVRPKRLPRIDDLI